MYIYKKSKRLILAIILAASSSFAKAALLTYTALGSGSLTGAFEYDPNTKVFGKINLNYFQSVPSSFDIYVHIDKLTFLSFPSNVAQYNAEQFAIGGSGKGFEWSESFKFDTSILKIGSGLDVITVPWELNYVRNIYTGSTCNYHPDFGCTSKYVPNGSIIDTTSSTAIKATNFSVSSVSEPETYGMMLLGLGLLGFALRRKQA